jgi:hypothetical protein
MKIQILLAAATWAWGELQTFGQGTIRFNNRVPGLVDAPVYVGSSGQGAGALTGAMAQLYYIPPSGQSVALTPPTTFRTSSAAAMFYVIEPSQPVVVPGAPPGATVNVQMRAWIGGSSYETAEYAIGESNVIPVTLGGGTPTGTIPDAFLTGLQGFKIGILAGEVAWFNPIRVEDEAVTLNIYSSQFDTRIVEASPDLRNWQPILTNPPIRTDFIVPLSTTNGTRQFYRMRLVRNGEWQEQVP